jgi:hypothetical protein
MRGVCVAREEGGKGLSYTELVSTFEAVA